MHFVSWNSYGLFLGPSLKWIILLCLDLFANPGYIWSLATMNEPSMWKGWIGLDLRVGWGRESAAHILKLRKLLAIHNLFVYCPPQPQPQCCRLSIEEKNRCLPKKKLLQPVLSRLIKSTFTQIHHLRFFFLGHSHFWIYLLTFLGCCAVLHITFLGCCAVLCCM